VKQGTSASSAAGNQRRVTAALLVVGVLMAGVWMCRTGPGQAQASSGAPRFPLPVAFIPNAGQWEEGIRYVARAEGLTAAFVPSGVRVTRSGASLQLRFLGANAAAPVEALDALPGKVNFLIGGDPRRWKTNLRAYSGIVYRQAYPGVDVYFRGGEGRLKSEFVVASGAAPEAIRWSYEGARGFRIDRSGELVLETDGGELREARPEAYQVIEGRRVVVQAAYDRPAPGELGFRIGPYDRSRPLVIDPTLSYSTYLGGSGLDSARAIAVDQAGNAYVAGQTDSIDFPSAGAAQPASGGGVDAFVAKLNAAGSSLVYCTYLGGSWDDRAFGIAVDAAGSAYVTGWTYSPNFPTTTGARQRVLGGGRDAFVAKLTAGGNALAYSTYLGGSGHDSGNGIAVDGWGNAYVAGETISYNFPVANAFQSSNQGRQDAFALKLNAPGSALVWSTYLGGYGDDRATSIAVDSYGATYLTGGTTSSNFPTYRAFQSVNRGGQDVFVAKLSPDGRNLVYGTYLGGSGGSAGAPELGAGIRVDDAGCALVAGTTGSRDFPVVGALQASFGGGLTDAFAAKLSSTGETLLFNTYVGGYGADSATGISIDAAGAATVTGYTFSANFPVANAIQPAIAGGYDAFVAKLNPQGTAFLESTYLGGSGSDAANGVAIGFGGAAYLAGQTQSLDFPLMNPIQTANAGSYGGFVAKLHNVIPAAGFRATTGATMLTMYGVSSLRSAGGVIASDVGISQNAIGDTYVVGRSSSNVVWLNIFQDSTQSWRGWVAAGGSMAGNPALAVAPSGDAYVVVRDTGGSFWLNTYRLGAGFQGWVALRGVFATDPAVALARDGTLYVTGAASTGVVWGGRYVASAGFQGWVPGGGAGAPLATGRPATAAGSDGAVYVAVKATDNAVWAARLQGDTWGTWYRGGGGPISQEPEVAATASGVVYVAYQDSSGRIFVRPFREGSGDGWQPAIDTYGVLEKAAVATAEGRFYVTGRTFSNELWWFKSGTGWTYLGYRGQAASNLSAAPR